MTDDYAAFEAAANKGEFHPFATEAEPDKPAQETSEATGDETKPEEPKDAPESDPDKDDQEHPDKPKGKGGFQRRIDKLTAEKRQLEAKLAEVSAVATPKPAETKPEAPSGKPRYEDFLDKENPLAAYTEAVTDWKVDQRFEADRQKAEQDKAQAEAAKARTEWEKAADAVREAHDDYDEALESVAHIVVPPTVQAAIAQSDAKAKLAYHLAKHPSELERIVALSPLRAAIEIGKLDAALDAPPEKTKSTVSKAPKPAATVTGKAAPKEPSLGDPDMPYAEFEKRANKEFGGHSY